MILLEIISGIPLWMSLKSRVERHGRLVTCRGLLAAQGRDPSAILRLQYGIVKDVKNVIRKISSFDVPSELADLIEKMLKWDPMKRISPSEALQHPFLEV